MRHTAGMVHAEDVAADRCVSRSAVSRAFMLVLVAAETRARIKTIVRPWLYAEPARSLITGRLNLIAVVVLKLRQ